MRDDRGRRLTNGPGASRELIAVGATCFLIGFLCGGLALLTSAATDGSVLGLLFFMVVFGVLMYATGIVFDKVGDPLPPRSDCRSCGFELRGLQRAADGCTVCPECGHAWRLDQPTE